MPDCIGNNIIMGILFRQRAEEYAIHDDDSSAEDDADDFRAALERSSSVHSFLTQSVSPIYHCRFINDTLQK